MDAVGGSEEEEAPDLVRTMMQRDTCLHSLRKATDLTCHSRGTIQTTYQGSHTGP